MIKLGAQVCMKTLISNFVKTPVVETVKKENLVLINAQLVRKTSFFSKFSKEDLWRGTLSVSNAGRRKGRGRGKSDTKKKSTRFDKTEAELRVSWPGFNTHVLKGDKADVIKSLPEVEKPKPVEPEVTHKRSRRLHPLDRGWSGRIIEGRKLGPPKPFENYNFEGFESVILKYKYSTIMTSILGRKRRFNVIVATGNGNGLLGLAEIDKFDGKIAIRAAQKKASKKLITIDLIEKHTVNHSFCSEYGKTKVFVFKMPKGFGLRCHRAITEICKLVGIENLHAKVEGPCNLTNLIKAFVVGLLRQKTYQEIADEKNLHLVEFKEESNNFPLVLASPKECLSLSQSRRNPVVFDEYIMGNRVIYRPEKKVAFYKKLPSWQTHLLKTLHCRNHDKVKIDLLVKYGAYNSHLTALYPECTSIQKKKTQEQTDTSE